MLSRPLKGALSSANAASRCHQAMRNRQASSVNPPEVKAPNAGSSNKSGLSSLVAAVTLGGSIAGASWYATSNDVSWLTDAFASSGLFQRSTSSAQLNMKDTLTTGKSALDDEHISNTEAVAAVAIKTLVELKAVAEAAAVEVSNAVAEEVANAVLLETNAEKAESAISSLSDETLETHVEEQRPGNGDNKIAESEEALRARAMAALEVAMARRLDANDEVGFSQIAVALADARNAGITSSRILILAESIVSRPSDLYKSLLRLESESPLLPSSGLDVRDFTRAARVSAKDMDEQALTEEAASLAIALARQSSLQGMEMRTALSSAASNLLERSSRRAQELDKTSTFAEEQLAQKLHLVAEAGELKVTTKVKEAKMHVQSSLNDELEARRSEAQESVVAYVDAVREEILQRLRHSERPVELLEELSRAGQSPVQRSKASNALAASLLSVETAILEGRSASPELKSLQDAAKVAVFGVAPQVFERLVAETTSREQAAVPSVPELRRSFAEHLRDLVAVALTPPSTGLLSGLASAAVGQILGRLYVLRVAADVKAEGLNGSTEAARLNLAALAAAADSVETGDVVGAIDALEALSGECRARAAPWISEARYSLLWRQTLQFAQAKARCLNVNPL